MIVCPLAFVAGLIDAIAGGGGLISLPAFLLAGLPVHLALGTNKLSSSMGTTIATIKYALEGYMVPAFVAVAVPCGLLGSCIGSNLVLLVDQRIVMVVMLAALPFIAYFILKTKDFNAFSKVEISRARAMTRAAAIAFCVGMYDGFYGPGTGTFLMLLLTAVGHMNLQTAAGTTKAINLSTNIAALTVFLINGSVLLPLGLAAGAANILGNYIGARGFVSHGTKLVRPVMAVAITAFACKLISDLLF